MPSVVPLVQNTLPCPSLNFAPEAAVSEAITKVRPPTTTVAELAAVGRLHRQVAALEGIHAFIRGRCGRWRQGFVAGRDGAGGRAVGLLRRLARGEPVAMAG